MKILFTSLLLCLAIFCYSQDKEPKLKQILVSKDKNNSLPIVAVTDYSTYVLISILGDDGYNTLKFDHTDDLIERGYGAYNDYTLKTSDGFLKYRVLQNTDNGKLNYKVFFDYVKGTNVIKKEFVMYSSLL